MISLTPKEANILRMVLRINCEEGRDADPISIGLRLGPGPEYASAYCTSVLAKLRREGLIERVGRGKYRVTKKVLDRKVGRL